MRSVVIISIYLLIFGACYGQWQAPNSGLRKNAIIVAPSINPGLPEFMVTASMVYERIIVQGLGKRNSAFKAKIGGGAYGLWGESGQYLMGEFGLITGQKNHHFETGLGAFYGSSSFRFVSASAGYRFQKPGGYFVFRSGVSFPEGIYFGFGVCFGKGN